MGEILYNKDVIELRRLTMAASHTHDTTRCIDWIILFVRKWHTMGCDRPWNGMRCHSHNNDNPHHDERQDIQVVYFNIIRVIQSIYLLYSSSPGKANLLLSEHSYCYCCFDVQVCMKISETELPTITTTMLLLHTKQRI
jgi:hypothetical protein